MGKIDLDEEEKAELLELGKDYAVHSEKILKEWKKELKKGYRYERCNTPEMRALEAEVKRRYGEILEKYKALRAEQEQDQSSTESRAAMQPCSFYAHLQAMPVGIYHLTNRQRTVWERSQQ